jgi:GNAT superfamily N-acetyltransferase
MEYVILGWPPDAPTLRLDHRRFAYAGKFVMSTTGKAVVRGTEWEDEAGGDETDGDETDGDETGDTERRRESDGRPTAAPDGPACDTDIGAAVAFNADRTDDRRLRLRYITVRSDLKGQRIGPRLAAFVVARAERQGYTRVAIAVNNPFAYEAMYRAGFEWTGRESGIAENARRALSTATGRTRTRTVPGWIDTGTVTSATPRRRSSPIGWVPPRRRRLRIRADPTRTIRTLNSGGDPRGRNGKRGSPKPGGHRGR